MSIDSFLCWCVGRLELNLEWQSYDILLYDNVPGGAGHVKRLLSKEATGIQLRLACDKLMTEQGYDEPTGKAKITPAYNLPCSYVIHTVGPIVSGILTKKHCEQLAGCYMSCLELASDNGLKSIAFCCISTGEFHFPQRKAAQIAVQTVTDFLRTNTQMEKVVFNVFKQDDYDIYKEILHI